MRPIAVGEARGCAGRGYRLLIDHSEPLQLACSNPPFPIVLMTPVHGAPFVGGEAGQAAGFALSVMQFHIRPLGSGPLHKQHSEPYWQPL